MTPTPHHFQRADGSIGWRVRFRVDSAGPPKSETFNNPREAAEFCRLVDQVGGALARQTRDAQMVGHHALTVTEALDAYLSRVSAHTTPGTVAEYRRMAARTWLPRLGPLPVVAVNREAVVDTVTALRTTETAASRRGGGEPVFLSVKSIRNTHALLSSVLQLQVQEGVIPSNPAKGVRMPSDQQRTREPVFLTRSEVARLIAATRPEQQAFVSFLVGTGLRWGEATALTVGDVDLDSPIPSVRVTKAWKRGERGFYLGSPKSKAGRRTVSLGASLVEELRPLLNRSRDALLFPGRGGAPMSSRWFHVRVWGPAITAAELGSRPRIHDLRHTHASMLMAEGVPLHMIQRRLGHENITTTVGTYGHLAPDAAALVSDAIERAMAQALPQIEP